MNVSRSNSRVLQHVSSLGRWLVSWSYMGMWAVLFVPVMLLLWPSRWRRIVAFSVFGRLIGRVMIFFAGASIPPGLPARLGKLGPAILVSNHTSYLDNFIAAWMSPLGTVATARRSTLWVPFFGYLYALSGNVLIKRDDPRQAVSALRTLIGLVKRHHLSAMVWPEGTRSADGRLQPFKRGFVHLALATRLPIVPVVVSGAQTCWPKGSFVTYRGRVGVQVLEPISTTEWKTEKIDSHVAEVWRKFAEALPEEQKPRVSSRSTAGQ